LFEAFDVRVSVVWVLVTAVVFVAASVLLVVAVAAAAELSVQVDSIELRFPVVLWIARWCNVAGRPDTTLPSCPLA